MSSGARLVNIQGVETDAQAGRRFLATRLNREKRNYRSPHSNSFWPENLRSYVTPRVAALEAALNAFLEHYVQVYYAGGVASGFAVELSANKLAFYVGVLKENRESNTQVASAYSYKVWSAVQLTHSDINKDASFRVEVASELHYALSFDIVALRERVESGGLLRNAFKKNYHGESRNISPEEIVEIVGGCFERSESSLRNKELGSALRGFRNQVALLDRQENAYKAELDGFVKELAARGKGNSGTG